MRTVLHLAALTACAVGGLALAGAASAQSYGGGYGGGYGGYAPSYGYGASAHVGVSAYAGAYVTSTDARPYEESRSSYAGDRYGRGDGYGRSVSYGSEDRYETAYTPRYSGSYSTDDTPAYGYAPSYGQSYAAPSYGYAPQRRPADDCVEAPYPTRRY